MLRILRSVSVLEKIAFTVILSRKYRIPVYILHSQNKQAFCPCYHIMSQSGVFIMIEEPPLTLPYHPTTMVSH